MKYLFINSVYGIRSTGKIISNLCHELIKQGNECVVAYGRQSIEDDIKQIQIGTKMDYIAHAGIARVLDNQGLCSKRATKDLLEKIDLYKPDVLWLHNIHGYYINYEMLFKWIKSHPEIEVRWTLHDCWAFTGHCSHFTLAKCEKWKTHCVNCNQKKEYPASYVCDASKSNFDKKKEAFTGVKNLTIVTPSKWLADLVKESFLKEYPVIVVNNTINGEVFKPTPSNFRKEYGLENKYILLGVAVSWDYTKGFQDMLKLRNELDDSFVIVLVGLTKDQLKHLPSGIIGIERIKEQRQLAGIYTEADVFINPTHQDNYPTVNLEARACGTPVVTYDVGGSPESAGYEHVVKENDIKALVAEIKSILRNV